MSASVIFVFADIGAQAEGDVDLLLQRESPTQWMALLPSSNFGMFGWEPPI